MKVLLATSALALAMVSSVQAADLIVAPMMDEPMMASSAHDWSGFYAGVFGGYGWGNTNFAAASGAGTPVDVGTSGWLLGVDAGVNQQWDMFVLGVEGDVAWANIGGSAAVAGPATLTTTTNWLATLRGRAGVAVDKALLYATAGVAFAGVSSSAASAAGTNNFSATHTGWTAGVGLEYAVTDDFSLKAEYAYVDLGAVNDGGALTAGAGGTPTNIHPTFHTVKVGANFHF